MSRVTVPFFISHQGCPQTCVFCDQRTISGSAGQLPGSVGIASKIRLWKQSAGNRSLEVAFFGGTFTALPPDIQDQLLDPVQPFLNSGEVAGVRLSTRPDSLDVPTVRRLAEKGVRTIEVGVQSMDDGVLASSGRGHDAAASEAALKCIKDCGLIAGAQLMPGLPGDTPEISLQSLKRVIAAGADFVRLYPAVVLGGTELARRYLAGDYQPLSVDEGVAVCKVLLHSALHAGVEVIRIGLQADEGLNPDSVLAGCWHPALGHLVRSELFFDLLVYLSAPRAGVSQRVTLSCHPTRVSDLVGHGRKNMRRLNALGISVDRILPDEGLSRFECAVYGVDRRKGSIISDLEGRYA
jgi:histone acetyltransferase (RNA polymerase elongator complex component)